VELQRVTVRVLHLRRRKAATDELSDVERVRVVERVEDLVAQGFADLDESGIRAPGVADGKRSPEHELTSIEFSEAGEHELKGVPGTWRLYAVRA
jgi:hypothetical protein